MDPVVVIAVCAVVLTVVSIAVGAVLLTTLAQLREAARRVEEVSRRLEPTIGEVEQTVREWRELGMHLAITAERAERVASRFEGVGTKAAQASRVLLGGIGGPLGRAFALWSAFRAGAGVLLRVAGRRRGARPDRDGDARSIEGQAVSSEGGNHE